MNDVEPQDGKSRRWARVERILLILTFLCVCIGTVYSVRTARRALEQADAALRPWIAIPEVRTHVRSGGMDTKFEITNIGQVPAYVQLDADGYLNGERVHDIDPPTETVLPLFPGQRIWRRGMTIEGDCYKRIVQGDTSVKIVQEIRVDYGIAMNKKDYFTRYKVGFDAKKLPKIVENTEQSGLGIRIDGDFE